jgi:coenzyme F420-reducing hydrogenase alpha subunit
MSPKRTKPRSLRVGMLARVEGEGAMHVEVRGDVVTDVRLEIMEPPRFFEALLRGRSFLEAPDITARICGICPVASGRRPAGGARDRCCGGCCGEWRATPCTSTRPDFLGYPGALEMAADHPDLVTRGLRLKKAGNTLMELVGGRAIHPVNVKVGGFWSLPDPEDLAAVRPVLVEALDDALATVRDVATFEMPDIEQPHTYLSLRRPDAYPLESGSIVTSEGAAFEVDDFFEHVVEEHVPHSHALHARLHGGAGPYAVGPLARYTLCHDLLSPRAAEAAASAGLGSSCRNPFRSIVVRAVEVVEACVAALEIVDGWHGAPTASVPVPARAGVGVGASEAPRGILVHRYRIAADGAIADAVIVPPTAQNQPAIEADLAAVVQAHLHLDDAALTEVCETAIRNYDPCISCATHFLDLTVQRS